MKTTRYQSCDDAASRDRRGATYSFNGIVCELSPGNCHFHRVIYLLFEMKPDLFVHFHFISESNRSFIFFLCQIMCSL